MGLKYFNCNRQFIDCPDDLYSFARFEVGGRRVLLVASNFRPSSGLTGNIRVPLELARLANLPQGVSVRLVLDRGGAKDTVVLPYAQKGILNEGFPVSLENQESQVYVVE